MKQTLFGHNLSTKACVIISQNSNWKSYDIISLSEAILYRPECFKHQIHRNKIEEMKLTHTVHKNVYHVCIISFTDDTV